MFVKMKKYALECIELFFHFCRVVQSVRCLQNRARKKVLSVLNSCSDYLNPFSGYNLLHNLDSYLRLDAADVADFRPDSGRIHKTVVYSCFAALTVDQQLDNY